ncbi:MAG: hypothetical protein P8166_14310 [Candidatus Thiodiazotropha sp.]
MRPKDPREHHILSELQLTRSLLLEGSANDLTKQGVALRNARNYSCVTHWEEILCVAINTKLERLMAVVSIHRPEGYSSLLNNRHSTEFIRFFIDWGRGEAYQPVCLAAFEVSDSPQGGASSNRPYHQLVTTRFDSDRYWDCVLDGIQPKVCAVLSWNQRPDKDSEYQPIFGNVVKSRIRTESVKDVMALYEQSRCEYVTNP